MPDKGNGSLFFFGGEEAAENTLDALKDVMTCENVEL